MNTSWGVFLRNIKVAVVSGNDIHRNYCGSIRLCINRFDSTLIRNNVIHDHTGPHLVQTSLFSESIMNTLVMSDDFKLEHSKPAIMMSNKIYNNDLSYCDISDMIISCDYICHYCQKHQAKQACPSCGEVLYCRNKGAKTHEIFCNSFRQKYTFTDFVVLDYIQIKETP
jgi:hypothetical protein